MSFSFERQRFFEQISKFIRNSVSTIRAVEQRAVRSFLNESLAGYVIAYLKYLLNVY